MIWQRSEFFEQFRQVDLGSNGELQKLVDQAQQVIQGVTPADLRQNDFVRAKVVEQLAGIQTAVDGLMVSKPRRLIELESKDEG
jgi:hypothetical protein